jgi:cobyrinic acid a,c-diamide synthase
VGSDHHVELLREAIEPLGVPVVGALRRDERVAAPERHLGLVPAVEHEARTRAAIAALAATVLDSVDLDGVLALARSAPPLAARPWSPAAAVSQPTATIAIARGHAFSFHYEENLELLRAAGATLAPFDPASDAALPAGAGALILAGGFPEIFGAELSANAPLREEVAAFARAGRPVLAECGGLLYLCEELDGLPMCGVLPARGRMAGRLSIGYRAAVAQTGSPLWGAGEEVRGHEFHYSAVEGDGPAAWELSARGVTRAEGFATGGVHASYLHVHWAAFPQAARRLVEAAARRPTGAPRGRAPVRAACAAPTGGGAAPSDGGAQPWA